MIIGSYPWLCPYEFEGCILLPWPKSDPMFCTILGNNKRAPAPINAPLSLYPMAIAFTAKNELTKPKTAMVLKAIILDSLFDF